MKCEVMIKVITNIHYNLLPLMKGKAAGRKTATQTSDSAEVSSCEWGQLDSIESTGLMKRWLWCNLGIFYKIDSNEETMVTQWLLS